MLRMRIKSGWRNLKIIVLFAPLLSLLGCATLTQDVQQKVSLRSSLPNSTFTVFDAYTGKAIAHGVTPADVPLKRGAGYGRGASYRVVIEHEGFPSHIVDLLPHATGWYSFGNIFGPTIIGWLLVDPATGGMWSLEPGTVEARFTQQ